MKRTVFRFSILMLCLLATPLTPAGEGRIPIFESIVLDGSSGNISGKYVVTRNIVPAAQTEMIRILGTGSEEIEIDFNGFTIGGSTFGAAVYTVVASNVAKLKLRNGTLFSEFGEPGCFSASASGQPSQLIIEDVVMKCGNSGFTVSNWDDLTIRRNSITAEGAAISISGTAFKGLIEDNIIRGGGPMGSPSGIGITAASTGLIVRRNNITASGGGGISISGSKGVLIESNEVNGGAGGAVRLIGATGCRVRNNSVVDSLGSGLTLVSTNDCLVVDNVATGNDGSGIELLDSDGNHFERNVTNNNGGFLIGFGLHFNSTSDNNTYGRNTAIGNAGPAELCSGSANPACGAPEFCDEGTGNKSFMDNLVPGPPPC